MNYGNRPLQHPAIAEPLTAKAQMSNSRIHVRIGAHEFSASGPAEDVKQQYADFLKIIGRESLPVEIGLSRQGMSRAFNFLPGGTWEIKGEIPLGVDPEVRKGMYLLLTLYGNVAISRMETTTASILVAALRDRGIGNDEDRVDRVLAIPMAANRVVKSGTKRGSCYALTQAGVEFIEDVIVRMKVKK